MSLMTQFQTVFGNINDESCVLPFRAQHESLKLVSEGRDGTKRIDTYVVYQVLYYIKWACAHVSASAERRQKRAHVGGR
jgi:hypothetical protein